jgi:hypothetical protein
MTDVSPASIQITESAEGIYAGRNVAPPRWALTPVVLVGVVYAGTAWFVGRRLPIDVMFAVMLPGLCMIGVGLYLMWKKPSGVLVTAADISLGELFGRQRVARTEVRAYAIRPPTRLSQAPTLEFYGDGGTIVLRHDTGTDHEPVIRELFGRLGIPEAPPPADRAPQAAASVAGLGAGATATYRAPKRLTFTRLMAKTVLLTTVAIVLLAGTRLVGLGLALIWAMLPWALHLRPQWTKEILERLLVKVTPEQVRVRSFGRDTRLSRAEVAAFHIDVLPPRLVLHRPDGSVAEAVTLANRVDRDALRSTLREAGLVEV